MKKDTIGIRRQRMPWWAWLIISLFVVGGLATGGAIYWYHDSLEAVGVVSETEDFEVLRGENVSEIGQKLLDKGFIKNVKSFELYNRINKTSGKLQVGNYSLNKSMTVADIVTKLTTGESEQMSVTFFPGATLNFRHSATDTTPTHREALKQVGFSDEQIDEAFSKSYSDHALFKLLPDVTSLEGLIYGDTFSYGVGSSIDTVLRYNFDHYYNTIVKNDLVKKYEAQGLSLYDGIKLASIIEREAKTEKDRAQVAQVFLRRMKLGQPLGSDVTYHYANRLAGTANDGRVDSPYNLRKYTGLTPTPISTPGETSLLAVANPAEGDYLYFLAGDDNKTYFAHTNQEHERNIREHCKIGCSTW